MPDPAHKPLTQVLADIPDALFWVPQSSPPKPAYNQVFAEVLRVLLTLPDHDATLSLRDVYAGRVPNLSSFQRAVAKEASRRRADASLDPEPEADPDTEAAPPAPPSPPPAQPPLDLAAPRARARAALSPAVADAFLAHLDSADHTSTETLSGQLAAYLAHLPEALTHNEFLDLPLATAIATACSALLAATKGAPPEHRALVAAAVTYFVDPADGEHDLLSPVGFFDDAEVVAWVIDELGLAIRKPAPGVGA